MSARSQRPSSSPAIPHTLDPNAAGIDIGNRDLHRRPRRPSPHPVRRFATFTDDLLAAADWLKQCRIDSVAMESTGVYWIPLFQILTQIQCQP